MGAPRGTPEERLWRRTVIDPESGCRLWQGAQDGHGYGQINVDGRPEKVHRLGYRIEVGEIPEGLSIDHVMERCPNRNCWNPEHLEVVTLAENTLRALAFNGHYNAKKMHCPQNHPYDEANTRYASRGYGRVCRECRSKSSREYRKRKKTAK